MKILIIDDDSLVHSWMQSVFKKHEITSAYNAQQARLRLKETYFDVVIIDIMLNDELGYSIATYIRQVLNIKSTKLIFFSSLHTTDSIDAIPVIDKSHIKVLMSMIAEIENSKNEITNEQTHRHSIDAVWHQRGSWG